MSFEAKNNDDWKKAFAWYNHHLHLGAYPLGMGCRPCWMTVLTALKKAKQDE